jgi:hypothetical protein
MSNQNGDTVYLNILMNTASLLTFHETNKTKFVNSYEVYAIECYSFVCVLLIITFVNDSFVM